MKRAFVTGATGYIGRALLAALARRDVPVTSLIRRRDRSAEGPNTTVAAAPSLADKYVRKNIVVSGDLFDDIDFLAEAMRDHDVVFHLAAVVSFAPSARNELLRVNGDGTRCILEAARRGRVGRVVVVSSACTVGLSTQKTVVLDEETPFNARLAERNPYLASKRETELHAIAAARHGQEVVIVNPTTVFGPGDRSLNSGTMFRQVARARVLPVPPGGTNVVDIADVSQGLIAAALRGQCGRKYILGGSNVTFAELFRGIAESIGRSPRFVRVAGVARWPLLGMAWAMQHISGNRIITPQIIDDTFAFKYYSSNRAAAELDWRPTQSWRQTLASAWEYYRQEGLISLPVGAAA